MSECATYLPLMQKIEQKPLLLINFKVDSKNAKLGLSSKRGNSLQSFFVVLSSFKESGEHNGVEDAFLFLHFLQD